MRFGSGAVLVGLWLGAILVAGCGSSATSSANSQSSSAATSAPASAPFTLEEGFEHDVCGIGISVKFIPATATSASVTEAVLQGGPVSNVPDNVQDHTGDQPLPSNAAQLTAGSTATVVGKSFRVLAVNAPASLGATGSVQLQPTC